MLVRPDHRTCQPRLQFATMLLVAFPCLFSFAYSGFVCSSFLTLSGAVVTPNSALELVVPNLGYIFTLIQFRTLPTSL